VAPVHAADALVGEDPVAVVADIREAVAFLVDVEGDRRGDRAGGAVGAAVVYDPVVLRQDRTVLFHGGLDRGLHLVHLSGAGGVFFAREDQFHGFARLDGEKRSDEIARGDFGPAAERAPRVDGADPHAVERHLQEVRQGLGAHMGARIGHPQVQEAVRIGCDDRIRLHHGVGLSPGPEGVLPDEEGLLYGLVHLAHVDVDVDVDVVLVRFVDLGRTFLHGLFGVENGRERLEVDLDAGDGLEGGLFIDRRDRRDVLADVARLVPGQHRVVLGVAEDPPLDPMGVEAADGGLDPFDFQGPRQVDAADQGMGMGAPEDLGDEHVGKLQVCGVMRRSGDFGEGVASDDPFTDDIQIILHNVPLMADRLMMSEGQRGPGRRLPFRERRAPAFISFTC